MFELVQGNLFDADAEAFVNTVNTEGVMGKGVALQFRNAYPDNYKAYRRACRAGDVRPGRMFIHHCNSLSNPKYIINFPTKRHWRSKSRLDDIETGLQALICDVRRLGIRSVAVPPLGCGLGGLSWEEVQHLMRLAFEELPEVRWLVYEPSGLPKPLRIAKLSTRPNMTVGRAVIIGLIKRYLVPGFVYEISLLEIQKLVYFLVEAGEELNKVKFEKAPYGPYADVLRHVLERLDGHFINGYAAGLNKPEAPIMLDPMAVEEAEQFLREHNDTRARFDRVSQLVEGFETPLGMELLATVHWAATREIGDCPLSFEIVFKAIQDWNTRKAHLMRLEQVEVAFHRLKNHGWLS